MRSTVIRVPDVLLPDVRRLIDDWRQAQSLRPATADDLQPMDADDWAKIRFRDEDWAKIHESSPP